MAMFKNKYLLHCLFSGPLPNVVILPKMSNLNFIGCYEKAIYKPIQNGTTRESEHQTKQTNTKKEEKKQHRRSA